MSKTEFGNKPAGDSSLRSEFREMKGNTMSNVVKDEDFMEQNHERGPGWFLKITYGVVIAFCIYYGYTYWNWQSSYDEQQTEIQTRLR